MATFNLPIQPHRLGVCSMATIGDQLQTYRTALAEAQARGTEKVGNRWRLKGQRLTQAEPETSSRFTTW